MTHINDLRYGPRNLKSCIYFHFENHTICIYISCGVQGKCGREKYSWVPISEHWTVRRKNNIIIIWSYIPICIIGDASYCILILFIIVLKFDRSMWWFNDIVYTSSIRLRFRASEDYHMHFALSIVDKLLICNELEWEPRNISLLLETVEIK